LWLVSDQLCWCPPRHTDHFSREFAARRVYERLLTKASYSLSAKAPPRVAAGPIVQENAGRTAPVRTYQDLLSNPYDEALFDYYFTSRLALVALTDGAVRPIGEPGLIMSAQLSPDGRYILQTRVKRPFSYAVPARVSNQRRKSSAAASEERTGCPPICWIRSASSVLKTRARTGVSRANSMTARFSVGRRIVEMTMRARSAPAARKMS
jgi:hypothetical protein